VIDLLESSPYAANSCRFPLDKVATVISTQGMFFTKESNIERLILPSWGPKTVKGVPFQFVDPEKDKKPNVVMLYSKNGLVAPTMPKKVKLGVQHAGAGDSPLERRQRLGRPERKRGRRRDDRASSLRDGKTEDHSLYDGVHSRTTFAASTCRSRNSRSQCAASRCATLR